MKQIILKAAALKLTSHELKCRFPILNEYDFGNYDEFVKYQGNLGAVKDEALPLYIQEYVGLQSKMYALKMLNKQDMKKTKEVKKAKGLPMRALTDANFDVYKSSLFDPTVTDCEFSTIRSKKHCVTLEKIIKKGVTAYNDKIFAIDNLNSRPLGHYLNKN